MFVSDSELVALVSGTQLSFWSDRGEFRRMTVLDRVMGNPIAFLGSHAWLGYGVSSSGLHILESDDRSGTVRELVPPTDSFLAAHFPDPQSILRNLPALGPWRGGIAVGDRRSYAIALYDDTGRRVTVIAPGVGRNLPSDAEIADLISAWRRAGRPGGQSESAMRREFASTARPWFSNRIRMDGVGRMWVVGTHLDSVFADLFVDEHHIGRILLPCVGTGGRWDLNGEWLAIVCLPDEPDADVDAMVKLFRITDFDSGGAYHLPSS